MKHGVKFDFSDLFFRKKEHYCSKCGTLLLSVKKESVVNSKSKNAEDYDFDIGDTYMTGNIRFINHVFHCPVCNSCISVKEQKEYEKDMTTDNIFNSVDAVAEVKNIRETKTAFGNSYRGCCSIKDKYLTSCIIKTQSNHEIAYECTEVCNVSFLTPKAYPASIWVGREMKLYEGERLVGHMKIIEIENSILDRNTIFSNDITILSNYKVLNTALKLSLEWGKNWRSPIQNRLMRKCPSLSGNDIEKVSEYIEKVQSDIIWEMYCKSYDIKSQTFEDSIDQRVAEKYPWIDKDNLSSLASQGRYYAWHG